MAVHVGISITSPWPSEDIPGDDWLYMRIYKTWFRDGKLTAKSRGAFGDHDGAMSTDWSKYATPNDTRHGSPTKPASDYGVVRMRVRDLLKIPGQEVKHTPDWESGNRAHTDVIGDKAGADIREAIVSIAEIVIELTDPVDDYLSNTSSDTGR